MRALKRWVNIGAALVIAGFIVFWLAKGFLAIDRCLDSGGRWNYEVKQCEHE